jgi:hypothetical protein
MIANRGLASLTDVACRISRGESWASSELVGQEGYRELERGSCCWGIKKCVLWNSSLSVLWELGFLSFSFLYLPALAVTILLCCEFVVLT